MRNQRDRSRGPRGTMLWGIMGLALLGGGLGFAVGSPTVGRTQQLAATKPLVFDGVTVIDVEQGRRIPAQRVVIVGNRIKAIGKASTVRVPAGARVVDARGKYLIPGLWDMHTHSRRYTDFFYPLFIANGVTGIRDAWSEVPLDTLLLWRREILAGTRVGPPRQLLSGPAIDEVSPCTRDNSGHICVADSADARHVVDSLKAAGADLIKTYGLGDDMYFIVVANARRVGLPVGGHLGGPMGSGPSAIMASDSGVSIIDHLTSDGNLSALCVWPVFGASVKRCQRAAERFRQNGTWFVPTLMRYATEGGSLGGADLSQITTQQLRQIGVNTGPTTEAMLRRFYRFAHNFWGGATFHPGWLRDSARVDQTASPSSAPDSSKFLYIIQQAGLPILAGTDGGAPVMGPQPPGFALHVEVAIFAAEGLTPLEALQTATLNPAKLLHGTDSLGTVAPGKLADLVLLDADPLKDITNTTMIRAVVANGRYFDRATLDHLLADVQARAKQAPKPLGAAR